MTVVDVQTPLPSESTAERVTTYDPGEEAWQKADAFNLLGMPDEQDKPAEGDT